MHQRYLLFLCLTASLGGLLFGFDTAVISGANLYMQPYFGVDDWTFGWMVSSLLIGCAVGGLVAGKLCDRYGRRTLLRATAVLFFVSALGSGLAFGIGDFMIYRLIGGLAVGAASMVSPVYISEVAPANVRGKLVSLNQLTIVLGITLAFFSNSYLSSLPADVNWRWMLGVEALPAFAFFVLLMFLPEGPRWLVSKKRDEDAMEILSKINGGASAGLLLEDIRRSNKLEGAGKSAPVFGRRFMPTLRIAVALAVLQQITGINVIMYYAPNIFESIGLDKSTAILQTLTIGITMTVFTVAAMFLVDRIGRKPLLLYGSAGMGVSLIILTYFFESGNGGSVAATLLCLLAFISCFSISVGPVVWVLIGEIFPNHLRSRGVGIATFFLWTANFIVTLTFPYLLNATKERGFTFLPYSIFCVVLFVYTWLRVPETKRKSLEEMGQYMKPLRDKVEV